MTDETVTFVADWGEAHEAVCDCCAASKDVLTFNADEGETVVDLCRPCALALANGPVETDDKELGPKEER